MIPTQTPTDRAATPVSSAMEMLHPVSRIGHRARQAGQQVAETVGIDGALDRTKVGRARLAPGYALDGDTVAQRVHRADQGHHYERRQQRPEFRAEAEVKPQVGLARQTHPGRFQDTPRYRRYRMPGARPGCRQLCPAAGAQSRQMPCRPQRNDEGHQQGQLPRLTGAAAAGSPIGHVIQFADYKRAQPSPGAA